MTLLEIAGRRTFHIDARVRTGLRIGGVAWSIARVEGAGTSHQVSWKTYRRLAQR